MAKSKFGRAVLAAALGIFFGGGVFFNRDLRGK